MLSDLIYRLRSLFRKKSVERELEDELQFHFEHQREKYIRQGMSAEEATRKARLQFGGVEQIKEECRQARGVALVESTLQDIFYALRSWRRSPVFASVAILSLALGIGANTAIFSIIDTLLFKNLQVSHPEELEQAPDKGFSYQMYRDIKDNNNVFSGVLARNPTPATITNNDLSERGVVEIVSGNYFSVLGVTPVLGRAFTDDDDRVPLDKPVTIISYRYWRQRLSADPAVIGKTIRINNYPFMIIGVAPSGFFGIEADGASDAWVPLMMEPRILPPSDVGGELAINDKNWFWLTIFGRRSPGVTEKQAEAGLTVLYLRELEELGTPKARLQQESVHLQPAGKGISRLRADLRPSLYILMGVVGLVLLVACANIANLLLARCVSRQREIAVRLALGAGRARLIRQLLTESVLQGLIGGALGIAFSMWGVRLLLRFLPSSRIPLSLEVGLSVRVLGFVIAVSFLTGLIFGLIPALQMVRLDLTKSLKDEIAIVIGSRRFELRKGLVVFQMALSLVLLIAAGLFIRGLRNVSSINLGMNTENVLMATLDPSRSGYSTAQAGNFYRQLSDRVKQIPGVKSVCASQSALLSGDHNFVTFIVPGRPQPPDGRLIMYNEVSGDFFGLTGIQIKYGRNFGPQDTPGPGRVAIINETAAKYFFGEENPVGKKARFIWPMEIIGIAADSKFDQVTETTPRILYFSSDQIDEPDSERTIYLKTSDNPTKYIAALKDAVSSLDKNVPLFNIKTFEEQKGEALTRERLTATLSTFFGALALLLAAIGLYGVIAYTVQRRTREIGVRMALGAERSGIVWMVLRSSLGLSIIGIGLGVLLSLWLSRFLTSQLHGLSATDPLTIIVSSAVLLAVAIAAATIPAWSASRVDPTVALRYE